MKLFFKMINAFIVFQNYLLMIKDNIQQKYIAWFKFSWQIRWLRIEN